MKTLKIALYIIIAILGLYLFFWGVLLWKYWDDFPTIGSRIDYIIERGEDMDGIKVTGFFAVMGLVAGGIAWVKEYLTSG